MDFADSDEDCKLSEESYEDRDTIKTGRQALGLTRNYVPSWTSRDAFREFFQNWVDGMIEAHQVTRDTIRIVTQDSKAEWIATAHRPGSQAMIGFIRFVKEKGTLELSNFNAQLPRKALDIGVSTKRTTNNTAGTHGEGFKVASLVMVRKGYQVRYESSKFYWKFQFGGKDNRHLYCLLSPMKDKKLASCMLANSNRVAAGKCRGMVSNIWEDVTVKIGQAYSTKGSQIETSTFLDWIKVSFELNRPQNYINTADGDLILSKEFGGRMYLKGLFIGNSATAKTLKCGYNMASGDVNRDRERLTNGVQEAAILARIWRSAILAGSHEALAEYTKMLRESDQKQWADVNLAESNISRAVATKIVEHLLTSFPGRDVFFHGPRDAAQDASIIRTDLKKVPISLPMCLWDTLKRWNLLRSPEEHCNYLLQNAPKSTAKNCPYSRGFKRALSAALALDEQTEELSMTFKANPKTNLEVLVVGSDLFINDKFLDFDRSHEHVSCFLWEYKVDPPDFPCDHIIIGLYESILREMSKKGRLPGGSPFLKSPSMKLALEQSLKQMPRLLKISPGNLAGELTVSWSIAESEMIYKLYGLELMCRVVLHRESTCLTRQDDLIFDSNGASIDILDLNQHHGTANCGCCFSVISQRSEKIIFKALDCNEKYFPMVARNRNRSFFGTPPPSTVPAVKDTPGDTSVNAAGCNIEKVPNEISQKASSALPKKEPELSSQVSTENHPVSSASPAEIDVKTKALRSQTEQLNTTLQSNRRELNNVKYNLRGTNNELIIAREALEAKTIELRQVMAVSETDIQRLSSTIEDLQGDNRQLHDSEETLEAQITELKIKVEDLGEETAGLRAEKRETEVQHANLSIEVQRLHAESLEAERLSEKPARCQIRCSTGVQGSDAFEILQAENSGLEKIIDSVRSDIKQVRDDRSSMAATLQSLSDMMKSVLDLKTKEQMVPLLQGILGMIQSMVNLGARATAAESKTEDIKRERLSEEENSLRSSPQPRKKQRTANNSKRQTGAIDLTDD